MMCTRKVESSREDHYNGLQAFPKGRYILLRSVSLALNIAIVVTIGGIVLMLNFMLAALSKRTLPQESLALCFALGAEAIIVATRIIADIRRACRIRND
jgi:hypothetical protein